MDNTIAYYDKNVERFTTDTKNVIFSGIQDRFLSYLEDDSIILDFGCGSGRDTKYFLSRGYTVEAIDGSKNMCESASRYTGIHVSQMMFSELHEKDKYDGIWACASILHLKKEELKTVLRKMSEAVKKSGYMYVSFKYGNSEGFRNERYFTDFTEDSFNIFISDITVLKIVEEWVSGDIRPGRGEEKWLNVILKKSDTI